MKIEKALDSKANYPLKKVVKPILFSISVAVTVSGCTSSKLSPVHTSCSTQTKGCDVEPVQPAIAGMMIGEPIKQVKPAKVKKQK